MGSANIRIFSRNGKKQRGIFIFVEILEKLREFDLIVAGGGAAGIMAAGVAAAAGKRVLVCEKMEKPQRKVRISGKGRCNLTNMRDEREFLAKVRSSADFLRPALQRFSNRDTVAFFERIGVPLTVERGERVFPSSGRAWDIADAHIRWCKSRGAEIACHTRIAQLHTRDGRICGATIVTRDAQPERIGARNVLIATGGVSYPATGSTGDGYTLAHALGHSIVGLRPSLTPLESDLPCLRPLRSLGLRNISAALLVDGRQEASEFGEMEFTPYLAGPVVLRLSRMAVDALIDGHRVELALDLKPALTIQTLTARIARERDALAPKAPVRDLLRKLLPGPMVRPAATVMRINEAGPVTGFGEADSSRLARLLKDFRIPVSDYRPFEEAIVTAGGVATAEVDPLSMQSRLVGGLYFAGEVLDIDADTGGFNLQIAYSTGHLAGQMLPLTPTR